MSRIIVPNQPEELRIGQGRVALATDGQIVLQQAVVVNLPMTVSGAKQLLARLQEMITQAEAQEAALQHLVMEKDGEAR